MPNSPITLTHIQSNKPLIALPLAEVNQIDERLAKTWCIDFHDEQSLLSALAEVKDQSALRAYQEAYDRAAAALRARSAVPQLQLEAPVFEAMAQPELLGPMTSAHRAYIVDGVAAAIGLVRLLDLRGPILDLGCHAGFAADLLATHLPNEVIGIDPCAAAIETGRRWPSLSPRVKLIAGSLPEGTTQSFDFIYSVNSFPQRGARVGPFLSAILDHLNPGGVAFIASSYWQACRPDLVNRILKSRGASFAYADVIGGFGGATPTQAPHFSTQSLIVLVRAPGPLLPGSWKKLAALVESEWETFRSYANAPITPAREKTQAFERAIRVGGDGRLEREGPLLSGRLAES